MRTVLVVDDEPDVVRTIRAGLESEGYAVVTAETREEVFQQLDRHEIDIVTLDLGFGPNEGFAFAREIRAHGNVPIIVVTGRAAPMDRVRGLEHGADDYITKPFHFREVALRIEQVLHRYELEARHDDDEQASELVYDHSVFDTKRRIVRRKDGNPIDLTETELRLLELFVRHPGRVLTRDELSMSVRGQEWSPLDRTIDGHVARLRRKIEPEGDAPSLIKSVRGVGYVFTGDVHEDGFASDRGHA